jgi:hypothetical protein
MNGVPLTQRGNRIYLAQVPMLLTRLESLGLLFRLHFQNLNSSQNVLTTVHSAVWDHMEARNLNVLPDTRTEYTSWASSPFFFLKTGRKTPDNAYKLHDIDAVHPPSYSGISELMSMRDTRVDEGSKRLLWICSFIFFKALHS